MHLQPGTSLGNYVIESLAGRGGMGEVYLATDQRLNRPVAIKVLPVEWSQDRSRRDRFEREARITSSLNHPNLVVLHDVGEYEQQGYFVMEYVAGETLAECLQYRGPMPVAAVARLGAQVADGLASAHAAGVVHRDLKPANIMVTAEDHVKILDFGIGKRTRPAATTDATATIAANVTMPGDVLGTAPYMSPEQASGREVGHQSDQFALGIILHEMLTGRHPFARDSQVQTLNAIIESPAPALGADVPLLLRQAIERCLDKVPERRFADTSVLARVLHEVDDGCRGERVTGHLSARTPVRGRMAIAAVAAVVTLLAAAIPAARWVFNERRPAPAQIAIIPFTSAGGDNAEQALADGLADVLSRQLAAFEQPGSALRIVPASTVRLQPGSPQDARRAFGVDTAIAGTLQRHGAGLRLSLQRIDTISGQRVDGDTLDFASRDAVALQARALDLACDLLDLDVTARTNARMPEATQAPGTAEFYLQGRGYLQRYEQAANIDAAIALFERALALTPNDGLVHAALAEAFWRRYDLTKDATWAARAQAAGTAALRSNPQLSQVRVTLGLLANGTGQYETAAAELKQVLAAEPANPDAFRELGRAYEGLGDKVQAESVLKAAVTARPGDWSVYNALGAFYVRQRRPAEAAVQFERVVQLTPDNSRGFTNLGSAYGQLRDWDRALAALKKATALSPNERTWSNLATAYFGQKRFADAAAAYERAIALGATNHLVWFNKASALNAIPGRESHAKEAYLKAAELGEAERRINPRQATLLARLALCYAHGDNAAQARALALEAEGLAPKNAGVWLVTAQAFEHIGDRPGALRRIAATLEAGLPKADVESASGLDALKKDPAYASLLR